jgi:hypothetical protein
MAEMQPSAQFRRAGTYIAPGFLPQPASATITATSVAEPKRERKHHAHDCEWIHGSRIGAGRGEFRSWRDVPSRVCARGGLESKFWRDVERYRARLRGRSMRIDRNGNIAGSAEAPEATYTAPTIAPSPNSVVLTATPLADPTKAASAIATINPIVQIRDFAAIGFRRAFGGTTPFQASVTGSANSGVTWDVNGIIGGNSTVGTITPSISNSQPSELQRTAERRPRA